MTDERPAVPPFAPGSARPITSGGEFLIQVFRSFAGYGVLFGCLVLMLRKPPWTLSAVDVVYWAVVCLVLWVHRREAVAAGQPAAWRRLRDGHVLAALGLWIGAHSLHAIE